MVTQDPDTSYENQSTKLDKRNIEDTTNKTQTKSVLSNEISVRFGRFNKKSYKSGLPYSGKVNSTKFKIYLLFNASQFKESK